MEEELTGSLWNKIKDFVYEIKDPSGGTYQVIAKEELNQEQLFAKWTYAYVLCGKARPQDGETHIMVV